MTTALATERSRAVQLGPTNKALQNALEMLFDAHREQDLLRIQVAMRSLEFCEYMDRMTSR